VLVRHRGNVDQQPGISPAQLHLRGIEQAEQEITENMTGRKRPQHGGHLLLWLNRVTNCANVAMSPSSQPVSRSARRSRTACAAAARCGWPTGVRASALPPAPRLLAVTAQQPGRDQLLESPGQGGLVQAEVRA
jgi:hypothetical protein